MTKKIILGSVVAAAIVGITLGIVVSYQNLVPNVDEPKIPIKKDIVMSTKVSRPGCEKTDSCYTPSKFVVESGHSVTWVNEDAAFHSVTSGFYGKPNVLFDSGYLDPEESFSFTFTSVGTYDYFCTLHPWMKGQIIVN